MIQSFSFQKNIKSEQKSPTILELWHDNIEISSAALA